MKGAAQMAGKVIPPQLNKRLVNNNSGLKQTTSQEVECTPASQDKSPPNKKRLSSKPATQESADFFEATAAAGKRNISMLVSEISQVLSERAAADTSQMEELEGILAKAGNYEFHLKEKKRHLRQTLALISDKLKG